MKNLGRTLIVASFSCALLACGSGGDDVNNLFDIDGPEVEVPTDADLSIALTRPTVDGTPTGHQKTLKGTCGTAGVSIRVDMNGIVGQAYTACGVDETWEVDVDTSTAAVGNITLSARMVTSELSGSPVSVVVNKLGTECDSPAARADTFANTSTTGVPPWIVCTSLQLTNIGTAYQADDITLGNDISFGGGNYASQGNTSGGFQGVFEGRNFEISDFTINATAATQQGLFREATGADFQNISFYNITINGRYYIGLLAGYLEVGTTTVSNIVAEDITLESFDAGNNGYAGALFGATRNGATDLTINNVNVTNITIPALKNYNGGLIGYVNNFSVSLDVDKVAIESGDISGRAYVGGLFGFMHNGMNEANIAVNEVRNSANITCSNSNCGGIAGYGIGRFQDMYNSGNITQLGGSNYGGLIGYLRDGYIRGSSVAATREAVTPPAIPTSDPPTVDVDGWPVSCYNTGNVTAPSASSVGGIVGSVYRLSEDITSCYNTGTISGGVNYVGGLVGYAERIDVTDSFSTGNVVGDDNYVGGLIGYMTNQAPSSTLTNSYVGGNVTSNGLTAAYVGGIAGRWNPPTAISGIWYNGNISAVDGDDSGRMEYIGGIFGYAYTEGTTLTNAHSAGNILVTTTGTSQDHRYIAGLIGQSRTDVDQSSSTMDIDAQQARGVGGLIGYDYRQTITNSYATGDVIGTDQVGGLLAYAQDLNNVVEDSFATGDVTTLNVGGNAYAGGLVGVGGANIRRCYASGNVTGDGDYIGGLEGGRSSAWNRDLINSFATGDVDGGTRRFVGGLSGYFRAYTNRLVDNFATGNVRGGDYTGGLVGYLYRQQDNAMRRNYAYGTVTRATGGAGPDTRFGPLVGGRAGGAAVIDPANNYYNSDFMPQDEATLLPIATPNITNVNPLTSAQMTVQGNFVGFDFGTPFWEMPSGTLALPGHSFFYTYPVQEWLE